MKNILLTTSTPFGGGGYQHSEIGCANSGRRVLLLGAAAAFVAPPVQALSWVSLIAILREIIAVGREWRRMQSELANARTVESDDSNRPVFRDQNGSKLNGNRYEMEEIRDIEFRNGVAGLYRPRNRTADGRLSREEIDVYPKLKSVFAADHYPVPIDSWRSSSDFNRGDLRKTLEDRNLDPKYWQITGVRKLNVSPLAPERWDGSLLRAESVQGQRVLIV